MAHVLHMFPGPGRKSASIACLLEAFVTLQGLLTETHQLKATEKRDPKKKQGFSTIEAGEDVGTGCRQVMIECPR